MGTKGYEQRYFARKWNLPTAVAIALIREHGNDRRKLNAAALKYNQSKK